MVNVCPHTPLSCCSVNNVLVEATPVFDETVDVVNSICRPLSSLWQVLLTCRSLTIFVFSRNLITIPSYCGKKTIRQENVTRNSSCRLQNPARDSFVQYAATGLTDPQKHDSSTPARVTTPTSAVLGQTMWAIGVPKWGALGTHPLGSWDGGVADPL